MYILHSTLNVHSTYYIHSPFHILRYCQLKNILESFSSKWKVHKNQKLCKFYAQFEQFVVRCESTQHQPLFEETSWKKSQRKSRKNHRKNYRLFRVLRVLVFLGPRCEGTNSGAPISVLDHALLNCLNIINMQGFDSALFRLCAYFVLFSFE